MVQLGQGSDGQLAEAAVRMIQLPDQSIGYVGFILGADFFHGESARARVRRLEERQPIIQAPIGDGSILQNHQGGSGHAKVGGGRAGQEPLELFSARGTWQPPKSLQRASADFRRP